MSRKTVFRALIPHWKIGDVKPAFDRSDAGTITAGNASLLTDGAAAIWVDNEKGLEKLLGNAAHVKLFGYEIAGGDIFNKGLSMASA